MKTISVYNIKGGVAKTTTATNLSSCLAAEGYKVLLVDNGPQANATKGLGVHASEEYCILEVMTKEANIKEAIVKTKFDNLDLLPSHIRYIKGDKIIDSNAVRLLRALEKVKDDYDFCIIDNDPAVNIISTNSLVASDYVLIPIRIDRYALDGFSYLIDTIEQIQDDYNPNLKILGVVLTQYETRGNVFKNVKNDLQEQLKDMIFETIIRKNIKIVESPFFDEPIDIYDKNSTGAEDYKNLTMEVLERVK